MRRKVDGGDGLVRVSPAPGRTLWAPRGLCLQHTRTNTRLLEDLRDAANDAAWSAFDARYRPVLVAFARRLGFGPEDARDIAQQTLGEFAAAYRLGKYRREEGRLSSWLIGIARHVCSGVRRARVGRRRAGGEADAQGQGASAPRRDWQAPDGVLGAIPDEAHLTRLWEQERRLVILGRAIGVLRDEGKIDESTLLAFELFALRGVGAEQAAAQCGVSVDAVYVAKYRLTRRLREIVRELTHAFDEGD